MYAIKIGIDAILPRERLGNLGAEHLNDQESLSISLRTRTRVAPTLEAVNQILKNLGSLADFQHPSLQELQRINGTDYAKSVETETVIELAKRTSKAEYVQRGHITSNERLTYKMILELSDQKQEHSAVIYLGIQNRIIEQRTTFIDSVRRSIAEPHETLYYVCKNIATSVVVVHNHPSGSPGPSEDGLQFTQKMKCSCKDIGITCLDHIAVEKYQYYSSRGETNVL